MTSPSRAVKRSTDLVSSRVDWAVSVSCCSRDISVLRLG
ncbi:hypothetical protein [Achromobacter phage tuull]|nr:hypothetical protein [Achromobacter phage tuull]